MIIKGDDFKLTPINDTSPRFDLELLYTVTPKGGESRLEFKNVAYGISLEYAIEMIAQYRVTTNHKEEAISLKKYLKEFLETLSKIKSEINS